MKLYWLLFGFLLLPFGGWSQEDNASRKFKGGLLLGLSTSQIDGDGYEGWNKVGPWGGAYVNTFLSEKVNFQLEMSYIGKGSRQPSDPDNGIFNFQTIGLSYVEVPMLFQFKKGRFTYELGPSFGVLINDREEDQNGERVGEQRLFSFHSTEIAGHVGLNFLLLDNLIANVRVSRSILPVSERTQFSTRFGINGGAYSSVVAFSLRYQILK
ncbi:MAG: outer membrane beta-barrel protein [Salibacteraceae bacterium]